MSTKFIVHAGNLKTGSTAIQSFLKRRQSEIEQAASLVIPGFGHSTGIHAALVEAAVSGDSLYTWQQMARDVAESDKPTALLTSEVFIRYPAADLKAKLEEAGSGRTDVYFYFRPHIQMVTSQVAQSIKTGYRLGTIHVRPQALMQNREMNFVASLREYHAAFGLDHVHCREFARDRFVGKDVVRDFIDFVDLPKEIFTEAPAEGDLVNVTPTTELLALLHFLRLGFGAPEDIGPTVHVLARAILPKLQNRLIEALKTAKQTKFRLPIRSQAEIKEVFERERVEYFAETVGFEPTREWLDESMVAPDPILTLPYEQARAAILDFAAKLPPEHKRFAPVFRKMVERLPRTNDGGEPVIAIPDMPMFTTNGPKQNLDLFAVRETEVAVPAPVETEEVIFNEISFRLAKSATPPLFVMGLRKCGSTMLNQLMQEIAQLNGRHTVDLPGTFFQAGVKFPEWQGLDLREVLRPGNIYLGFRACPSGLPSNAIFATAPRILMFRDPRDALVSQYFSDSYSHSLPTAQTRQAQRTRTEFLAKREKARTTDINDYVLQNAASMDRTFLSYADVLASPLTLALRYEEFIFQKKRLIAKILRHFGLHMSREEIDGLLAKVDIIPTSEDPTNFVRTVTPGDHRRKLTPDTIAKLDSRLKNSLALYDYY